MSSVSVEFDMEEILQKLTPKNIIEEYGAFEVLNSVSIEDVIDYFEANSSGLYSHQTEKLREILSAS